MNQLATLNSKLEAKKSTIKNIIEKKLEDDIQELHKWREVLFCIVDESIDEKIQKLKKQQLEFATTYNEINKILESHKNGDSEDESE